MNDEYRDELIKKYRTEIFESDKIDVSEIDNLISDNDLKMMFGLNNARMCELINKNPIDKEIVKKILIANVNLYKLAKKRKISLNGSSFLMSIASLVDYNIDKLYDEIAVGRYVGIRKSR